MTDKTLIVRVPSPGFQVQTEGQKFFFMFFMAFMVKLLCGFSSRDIKAFKVPESRQRLRKYEVQETRQWLQAAYPQIH
jgi:hypothetical protein